MHSGFYYAAISNNADPLYVNLSTSRHIIRTIYRLKLNKPGLLTDTCCVVPCWVAKVVSEYHPDNYAGLTIEEVLKAMNGA